MSRFAWKSLVVGAVALVLSTWQGGCGADELGADDWAPYDAHDSSGWDAADSGADADAEPEADAAEVLPPEDEEPAELRVPVAGGRFVYLSNTLGDDVVVIDSETLTLDLVEVGDRPTELATLGSTDAAAVINSGSNDVSVIRTAPGGSSVEFEPIAPGANAISTSPDGRHGLTFYDVDARVGVRPPNMQEVTLLVLEPATAQLAVRTTVGVLPLEIEWTDDGETAYVIGWDGLDRIDFADVRAGYRPEHLSFGLVPSNPDDPASPRVARRVDDVEVANDGRLAVLRTRDAASLLVLDLSDDSLAEVALPAAPTDVDLAADGSFALAALRDRGQVARIELADPDAPEVFLAEVPGLVAGQVSLTPDGSRAVVFSGAAAVEALGVLELDDASSFLVGLQKEVRAVALTPDGTTAVVIHRKEPGNPDDPALDPVDDLDEIIDRTYGFSLVHLGDPGAGDPPTVVRIETPTDPGAWLLYPEQRQAYLTLRDDARGVRQVLVADLDTYVTDTVLLGSPPASLGLAPLSHKVFVGQEHPNGRITFITAEDAAAQTLTGFELNDWIVD